MRKKTKPNDEAKVDMTSLLDIVFIMLIFFIVSSTFIRESGIDVSEEKQSDNQDQTANAKTIFVHVCGNDTVVIDRRLIDVRAVRANVERKLVDDNRAVVIIESEPGAPTGNLVKVIDQTRAAKAKFSLVTTGSTCHQQLAG
jgi:biopolymer transport protein ExbD